MAEVVVDLEEMVEVIMGEGEDMVQMEVIMVAEVVDMVKVVMVEVIMEEVEEVVGMTKM